MKPCDRHFEDFESQQEKHGTKITRDKKAIGEGSRSFAQTAAREAMVS